MVERKRHKICGVGGSGNYYQKPCYGDVVFIINQNHKVVNDVSRKVVNLCLQMAPLSAFVQRKGWRVSEIKGKYVARILVLIQVIWLKGIQGMYVNKKLMFLVALAKLQKLINWVQVVFNNLYSWQFVYQNQIKKRKF